MEITFGKEGNRREQLGVMDGPRKDALEHHVIHRLHRIRDKFVIHLARMLIIVPFGFAFSEGEVRECEAR